MQLAIDVFTDMMTSKEIYIIIGACIIMWIILEWNDVQNHSKEQIQREKDRSKYSHKGDVSSEVYWIYTERTY